MSAAISFLFGLLGKIMGGFFAKKDAGIAEVADSNARAQERLNQQEVANELHRKAAAARNDAQSRVVRAITKGERGADTAADRLAREFPDAFRD